MSLAKTSLLNALAVAIKMITMLGLNKVLALYVGPAGYAALGQLQNFIQITISLASGSINTGVTKFTAEFSSEKEERWRFWKASIKISLISTSLVFILIILLKKSFALILFNNESYDDIFIVAAASLFLTVLNNLIISFVNGVRDFKRYVIINIIGSLIVLIFGVFSITKFGFFGALVSVAVNQSICFFFTITIFLKSNWFERGIIDVKEGLNHYKSLGKFTVMALSTAIVVPVSHVCTRVVVSDKLGADAAGYWEAMSRLSSAYLMFFVMTLSAYYVPKLATLKNSKELRFEVLNLYKCIYPFVIFSAFVVYILRDFFIILLFSDDFYGMRELFAWQLLGDVLKIGSWVLGCIVTAKAMVRVYIFSEVIFSLLFFLLGYFMIDYFGVVGVTVAHAVTYVIHWIFMFGVLKYRNLL